MPFEMSPMSRNEAGGDPPRPAWSDETHEVSMIRIPVDTSGNPLTALGRLSTLRHSPEDHDALLPGRDRTVRDHGTLDPVLGRLGSLEVRLATTTKDIRRAQRLRFKVFYEEMSAVPNGAALLSRRDIDDFDAFCDHLLVLDHDVKPKPFRTPKPKVVGTYRLLRQDVADRNWGFYTAGEYDIAPLIGAASGPALSGTRPLLRAEALSQQAHGRTALARDLDLRAASPRRRDDRLRQPRGNRSAQARSALELPSPLRARAGAIGRPRRWRSASRRWI